MLTINMTSPDGVTLATSGKYCEENVQVIPALQEKSVTPGAIEQVVTADSGKVGLSKVTVAAVPVDDTFRRWTVDVPEDIRELGIIMTDPWLATHRADEGLHIVVSPNFSVQGVSGDSAVLSIYAQNRGMQIRADGTTPNYQQVNSANSGNGCANLGTPKYPLTGAQMATAYMTSISTAGELKFRAASTVPIKAGSYTVIAWIA